MFLPVGRRLSLQLTTVAGALSAGIDSHHIAYKTCRYQTERKNSVGEAQAKLYSALCHDFNLAW